MTRDPRPILIVGGTGMLGRPVIARLLREGQRVRALVRNPDSARRLLGAQVDLVPGDVRDVGSIDQALRGTRAVHVSLRGASLAELDEVEIGGTAAIAAAAARAGVERLTYLSGAGIQHGSPGLLPVRIKMAAERAIKAAGVPFTILRPTHFMESLDLFVRGGKVQLLGPQPLRFYYIAADDYAGQLARLLAMPEASAPELTLLGPEPYTMRQALEIYVRLTRPDLKITEAPLALVSLVAGLTGKPKLKLVTTLFDAFRKLPETGDRTIADGLVGQATTTLNAWCHARAASHNHSL